VVGLIGRLHRTAGQRQAVARRIQTPALAALTLRLGTGHADEALLGVVLIKGGIARRLHANELAQAVVAVAAHGQAAHTGVLVALHAAHQGLARCKALPALLQESPQRVKLARLLDRLVFVVAVSFAVVVAVGQRAGAKGGQRR